MIKDGLVDIDDISVLKEAEKCASKLCCTDCKAVICEEKCECWNFAKKGAEFGYNKANKRLAKAKELLTRFIMGSVYFNGKETDLVEEAEQFISEVEK